MSKSNKAARKAALTRLRNARQSLSQLGSHHTTVESDEYRRRNDAVIDAEKDVRFGKRRGWQDVDWSNTRHVLDPRNR